MLGIALMTDRIHAKALPKEIRDSNCGDSSPEVEIGVVAMVEVAIFVVPTHCISQLKRMDRNLDQTVVKVAYCRNVVLPVPSAISRRQLQKKGVGPVLSVSKIKLVKGAPCVNPLSFAPSVQNVPHVVTEISVGGRLQSFWQVCKSWVQIPEWFRC